MELENQFVELLHLRFTEEINTLAYLASLLRKEEMLPHILSLIPLHLKQLPKVSID